MTNEEAKKMLEAKLECMKRDTSGTDIDCNYHNCDECSLCYEQGNMGEQKEALSVAIKALDSQRWIPEDATNGDVIKAMFPNAQRWGTVLLDDNENILFTNINLKWWNTPYKAESEDKE